MKNPKANGGCLRKKVFKKYKKVCDKGVHFSV